MAPDERAGQSAKKAASPACGAGGWEERAIQGPSGSRRVRFLAQNESSAISITLAAPPVMASRSDKVRGRMCSA